MKVLLDFIVRPTSILLFPQPPPEQLDPPLLLSYLKRFHFIVFKLPKIVFHSWICGVKILDSMPRLHDDSNLPIQLPSLAMSWYWSILFYPWTLT